MTVGWLRRGAAFVGAPALLAAAAIGTGCGDGDSDAAEEPEATITHVGATEPPAPVEGERPAGELHPGHPFRFPGRLVVRRVDPAAPEADGTLSQLRSYVGVFPLGEIACSRIDMSPAGPGLCLRRAGSGAGYEAVVLDADARPGERIPVDGTPSRVRVSPDGRYGAYTVFTEGDGYAARTSDFSTSTRIVDMRDGSELIDLADLDVSRGGRPVDLTDAELWSVTFGTGGRYYATLAPGPGAARLLIVGRVGDRRARVVAANVENPSLSPDGRRLAYRRQTGADPARWRFHIRDLAGRRDVRLAESLAIDDQPEWLGDDLVAYSDGTAVYTLRADGSGKPSLQSRSSTSPAWRPGAGPGR